MLQCVGIGVRVEKGPGTSFYVEFSGRLAFTVGLGYLLLFCADLEKALSLKKGKLDFPMDLLTVTCPLNWHSISSLMFQIVSYFIVLHCHR